MGVGALRLKRSEFISLDQGRGIDFQYFMMDISE
jgi:hypothetical protein